MVSVTLIEQPALSKNAESCFGVLGKLTIPKCSIQNKIQNFHLIRNVYKNSAATYSATPYLQKEMPAWAPGFAVAGEEKEKNNLHSH